MAFSNGGKGGNNNVSIPQLIRLTQGASNADRNSATQQLKYLETSHFCSFLLELVRILGSSAEETIGQGAGLLLLQCVRNTGVNKQRWMNNLDLATRNKIKGGLLSILGLESASKALIRSTAVNIISNLALLESLESWRDLLPYLISKCLSQPPNGALQHSSLKCIGQIAEMDGNLKNVSAKILECIANGMSFNAGSNKLRSEVQSEAMKCLYEIIELIESNMSIEKERCIIFQMVCCGAASESHQVRLYSNMCISRLIEYYYDLCEPFMQSIFQITKKSIASGIAGAEDENVTKQAIEIWSTTAEIEYEKIEDKLQHFGFINKCLELLVPIYLSALLKQKDEFDEDEWTIRKAAACSLELFAVVSGDNILPYVLQFVERNIGLSDWHNREAALCSFGCVLDGPSDNKLHDLVVQILGPILKLVTDEHEQVRISAVWTFGRICELLPSTTEKIESKLILSAIVFALKDKQHIANKACWCIASLTKNKHPSIYKSSATGYNLIVELLQRGARDDTDCTLIIGIHEAINGVIYCLESDSDKNAKNMLSSLLPELVHQMKEIINETKKEFNNNNNNNNSTSNKKEKLEYKLAGLLSSIQVILDKLGNGCLSADLSNEIMSCIMGATSSMSSNLVYEESLGLITHIARCIGNNFNIYLCAGAMQELLIKSIRNIECSEICRIGVGVAGDVYTQCAAFISTHGGYLSLQKYSDRIVSELLTILINNAIGMELKSHIVDALTDILIAHGSHAHRYSADILDKCLTIGCLTPPKECSADDDMMLIFNEIRCSIIDTTRSCLAELHHGNSPIKTYIDKINEFFAAIQQDLNRSNKKVLESCCKLLTETAEYCHNQQDVKQQLRTSYIQQILQEANNQNIKEAHTAFLQLK